MRLVVLVSLGLIAGCGAGNSVVELAVTSSGPLPSLASLQFRVTNGNNTSQPPPAAASALPITVALVFDKSVSGMVQIDINALDANGKIIATGTTTANVQPSQTVSASVNLAGSAVAGDLTQTGDAEIAADLATPKAMADMGPPELGMPDLEVDDLVMPDLVMPDLVMPDLVMPDLVMPDLVMPDLVMPDLVMPDLLMPDLAQVLPVLTKVAPATGPLSGNIQVTLTGDNFLQGTTVAVAGVKANNVVVVSKTTITFTLPPAQAGAFGRVKIMVDNGNGISVTRADLFSYVATTVAFALQNPFGLGVTYLRPILTADVNNDGVPDIVTGKGEDGAALTIVLFGDKKGGFSSRIDLAPAGAGSVGVTVADLNNDGIFDLASVGPDKLSTFRGVGNQMFQASVSYITGSSPYDVVAVDLNGDKFLDLVVPNSQSSNVSVFLNNGNGTFGKQTVFSTPSSPESVGTADFDGDGKQDIAVACGSAAKLRLLHGDGQGGLVNPQDYVNDGSMYFYALVVGDFNVDGWPDVGGSNYGGHNSVSIFLNDKKGSFQPQVAYPVGTNPALLSIGDLNGDGDLDIVAGENGGAGIHILFGNGDGTFSSKAYPLALNGAWAGGTAVADLNGDGKPDIALTTTDPNTGNSDVRVLLNTSF